MNCTPTCCIRHFHKFMGNIYICQLSMSLGTSTHWGITILRWSQILSEPFYLWGKNLLSIQLHKIFLFSPTFLQYILPIHNLTWAKSKSWRNKATCPARSLWSSMSCMDCRDHTIPTFPMWRYTRMAETPAKLQPIYQHKLQVTWLAQLNRWTPSYSTSNNKHIFIWRQVSWDKMQACW
jgi:hypothetical protein